MKSREEIIFEVRPSIVILFYQLLPILLADAGLVIIFSGVGLYMFYTTIAILAVGLFIAVVIVINWYMTTYRVTTKRVESKSGILGFREEEISLDDVQHVDVKRTFAGTIFNYGTVLAHAAGANASVELANVSNPKMIAGKIEDLAIELEGELRRGEQGDKIVEK